MKNAVFVVIVLFQTLNTNQKLYQMSYFKLVSLAVRQNASFNVV